MRKISIRSRKDNSLDNSSLMPCVPGPACERPYGFVGAGFVLSPLSVKLSFDHKVRHELIVLAYFNEGEPVASKVSLLVDPSTEEKRLLWNTTSKPNVEAVHFLMNHPKMMPIPLQKGFKLKPVEIEKPWGREIWYTGIEERGVCQIEIKKDHYVDLPILLNALGSYGVRSPSKVPILLKILEPSPDPKRGSLYFELHEKKEEVYIVSGVSRDAWSSSVGKMKYGVSQKKRSEFESDDQFKEAFKSLCLEYETCRRNIDEYLADLSSGNSKVSSGEKTLPLEDNVPKDWREREAKLESEINHFVGWLDLRQGDVVKVQKLVPHSLQFGITVVEFQTPVYERLIVTFNQKVLTQSHWDVSKAFEIMDINPPLTQSLKCLLDHAQICIEEVVDFFDFDVVRLTQKSRSFSIDLSQWGHAIIFALNNTLTVIGEDEVRLDSGDACFIPAAAKSIQVECGSEGAVWLLGREKIGSFTT
jgi:hypothetical protein